MLEWQNSTLFIFLLFRKNPPLAESKWGLKIRPSSYHTRSRGIHWQEIIGMNNFIKEAGINNPEIAR